ncbi:hypothetical protein [Mesoterricola silvestris]|uniref:Uncharacterized protein n=1 Tax=Mesoterricola silvestris TaxID=2927979 RepID=A0AA48GTV2_9BACT|nr:hypothetical protein [Mesoterricola silvestris]BDU73952.1 hypothetical protein METEAL_31260 [Mesoterricola silvestris]
MNSALQGDMKTALPLFQALPLEALEKAQSQAVQTLLARFSPSPRPSTARDPWVAHVLAAYEAYWKQAMLGQATPEAAERDLFRALAPLAQIGTGSPGDGVGALEPLLETRLRERGIHALFGYTRPFRECMLWTSEEERHFGVELPEGHEEVRVVMLDGFLCLGWMGFATGDTYHTGGWTRPDRLFCLKGSYDLASEAFHVSYLVHEGQHFADSRRFPGLEQPELEYRAKLAELSRATTTQASLLRAFSANLSDQRNLPHPYANRLVMRDLAQILGLNGPPAGVRWEAVKPEAIREAAVRLLKRDSASRSVPPSRGPAASGRV